MILAINGFGRIGRLVFRQAFNTEGISIAAINDLGSLANLAYLLKHDSVYRAFDHEVSYDEARSMLIVDGKEIRFVSEKDATKLPWKELDIDCVVESTGAFESFEKAKAHLEAGAKRVLITAPAKDADNDYGKTVLMGISDANLRSCSISSNASCTTNAASPVMAVLSQNPGIAKAVLNTVHAYTATQSIVDGPVKGSDFRRGRAGCANITPSTTGAAIAVARALPELEGKFDGLAIRVPVITGSLVDITFVSKRPTTVEEVNAILSQAAQSEQWKGILSVTSDQIVSSDIIGMQGGSLVDLSFTKVIDGDLVKVLAWYDNEWGYVSMLMRHLARMREAMGA
jgi:glyceraldehyde 3-phosphate dehydrogenase